MNRTVINPSWRQLAQIPESQEKAAIIRALGIEVPPQGVSRTFDLGRNEFVTRTELGWVHFSRMACFYHEPSAILRAVRWPAGTPTGDALRAWLRRWGWIPKSEQQAAAPQENTKTII